MKQVIEMTPMELADEARRLGLTLPAIHSQLHTLILRNESYLIRRRARGVHTLTDEAMAGDLIMLGYLWMLSGGPQVAGIPAPIVPASPTISRQYISQLPPADLPVSITQSEHLTDEEKGE